MFSILFISHFLRICTLLLLWSWVCADTCGTCHLDAEVLWKFASFGSADNWSFFLAFLGVNEENLVHEISGDLL